MGAALWERSALPRQALARCKRVGRAPGQTLARMTTSVPFPRWPTIPAPHERRACCDPPMLGRAGAEQSARCAWRRVGQARRCAGAGRAVESTNASQFVRGKQGALESPSNSGSTTLQSEFSCGRCERGLGRSRAGGVALPGKPCGRMLASVAHVFPPQTERWPPAPCAPPTMRSSPPPRT